MALAYPKPKPSKKAHPDAALDTRESAKVRKRSEGRCEVWEAPLIGDSLAVRCHRAATQIHHMLGGRGTRGIGESALAIRKQAVCDVCHRDITGDVGGRRLVRMGGTVPLWNDPYRRVR